MAKMEDDKEKREEKEGGGKGEREWEEPVKESVEEERGSA